MFFKLTRTTSIVIESQQGLITTKTIWRHFTSSYFLLKKNTTPQIFKTHLFEVVFWGEISAPLRNVVEFRVVVGVRTGGISDG